MPRSVTPLFQSGRGEVRTIPAGANFLSDLATGLYRALARPDDPFALADATIYLPNRRSAQALAAHFFEVSESVALILPRIRALGDLDPDDAFSSFGVAIDDLPPPISEAYRLGHLAQLVQAFQSSRGTSISPTSAIKCARELAGLLDQIALADAVDWSKIDDLLASTDLAQHWQDSAQFLRIILDEWPRFLDELGVLDPATHQRRMAENLARVWREQKPDTPIIIAGSTGATAPTRALMAAALSLPKGLLVLPGLNTDSSDEEIAAILGSTSHPQFALNRTLVSLGSKPNDVGDWTENAAIESLGARRRLIQEALAPAELTASWSQRSADLAEKDSSDTFAGAATKGLVLVEASTETEEAELAALLLRNSLQSDDGRTALVTLDMGLALRVSAHLRAHGIVCEPSAGRPAVQTPLGSLLMQLAELLQDPSDPINLMTVLQHQLSPFEQEGVLEIDRYALRGPRLWKDLSGLRRQVMDALSDRRCHAPDEAVSRIHNLLDRLDDVLLPIERARDPEQEETAKTYVDLLETLASRWLQIDEFDSEDPILQRLTALTELCHPLGPMDIAAFVDILRQDLLDQMIPPQAEHPKIAIWGPLEARLQSADHIILAGLNEEHWPQQPAADSFLSRRFRAAIGLTDPDERIGLSAHDFAQLACTAKTTLLTAARRDGKPAVASRWLWRLRMLLRGAAGEGLAETLLEAEPNADPRNWLAGLRTQQVFEPLMTRPRPRPPAESRPKRLSVTRIESLIRDPYAVYCESILGLSPLDRLGQAPDARHRGTAIHGVLERFEQSGAKWNEAEFATELEAALRSSGIPEVELLALRERRLGVIREFLTWRQSEHESSPGRVSTELRGAVDIDIGPNTFKLTGVADRIKHHSDGSLEIHDFKMGAPPSIAQVKSGLSPQLPLLAFIAAQGGFEGASQVVNTIRDLAYIRFGTRFEVRRFAETSDIEDLVRQTAAGLQTLLTQFANANHPYLSAPRPERLAYPSEFARLARRDEWAEHASYD